MPEQNSEEERGVRKCPECGSERLKAEEGELVCKNCGTVLEENLPDESADARAFTAEERERKERTGSPITYTKADRGLKTKIGHGRGDLQKVSPEKRGQYYRIQKWQQRLDESKQRRMKFGLGEIERLVAVLDLPESLLEETSRLYEKALEEGVVKGRKIEHIVAALVYSMARNQGVPRTMSEIAEKSGIPGKELGKNYRYVARELDLGIVPVNPEDFIPRYAEELDLSGSIRTRARQIISEADERNLLTGRSPSSIVAASLYLAARLEGVKITQKEVADTVGVTQVTLRKIRDRLIQSLELGEELEDN